MLSSALSRERTGSDKCDAPAVIARITERGEGQTIGHNDSLTAMRIRLPTENVCAVK